MSGDIEVRISLRDYLEEQERGRREWMSATFATKDDLDPVRQDVAVLKNDVAAIKATGPRAATWGAAGTFVGGIVVAVLAFFGIKLPGSQ